MKQDEGLVLRFVDDYYDMTIHHYRIEVSIFTNITFIGNKNGTVFDYKNDRRSAIGYLLPLNKGETIKYENIIFKNYHTDSFDIVGIQMLRVQAVNSNNFYIIFNNCTFQNNNHNIFQFDVPCPSHSQENTPIKFINCNFL